MNASSDGDENDLNRLRDLELLASRICHDIVSPVGAINNGIEFLEEMGAESLDDALGLISYSAAQASAKLQAFRLAYGAGGSDPSIKPPNVREAFDKFVDPAKITQDWDPDALLGGIFLPPAFSKILMGALLMIHECLPRGGAIAVRPETEGGSDSGWIVTGTGQDAAPRPGSAAALAGRMMPDALEPKLAHPYFYGLIARGYGYALSLETQAENTVTLTVRLHTGT